MDQINCSRYIQEFKKWYAKIDEIQDEVSKERQYYEDRIKSLKDIISL